jgi:hypothetical protein
MSILDDIAGGVDRALVFEFVATFAKTEYALKRAGYVLANANSAEVARDRFAATHEAAFARPRNVDVDDAISSLLREPPRKQVAPEGNLSWKTAERKSEPLLKWVTILVRRVRNNLFHGGKFATGPEPDSARDAKLMSGHRW